MGPCAASQKLNADNRNGAGASLKWASALAPCHPVTKQQAGRVMLKTFMAPTKNSEETPGGLTLEVTGQRETFPLPVAHDSSVF